MNPVVIAELDHVRKEFRGNDRPALENVSGRIRAGSVTGLVGPDAAGKTTLLRIMAGLLAPSSGAVRIDGLDPLRDAANLREVIGYMPQKFGLYEDLSVAENLELHADLRGVVGEDRAATFERLLRFTDLARFTDRLAGKLSGGMKQKLGLACALLGHPKLLLLDEPGVGVDPISRRELWQMVNDLTSQGLAVVWSTAYLEEAERCAEVFVLNEGKLLYAGAPASLTGRVEGRCFQLCSGSEPPRQILARALRNPDVMDGVIQGRSVRLLLRASFHQPHFSGPDASGSSELAAVKPRFEDAFISELGGLPYAESALAQRYNPVTSAQEVVIEARDLTRNFGEFVAADRVSFAVKRGEIFGLLGPNGAGKSTTFRMMCGLLAPTSGTGRVMGHDLQKSASRARQCLGYMAQKFSLYGNLTVRQNLNFFAGAYGLRGLEQRDAVGSMTEVFHFQPVQDKAADTLPPGLKQRLALACALMHQPAILFLDEPTSGVDPITRREFWRHINGLVEKGVTVMVTTHFMDEAEYCDRIALVYRGRIIASGTPDVLRMEAATPACPDPTMEGAFVQLIERQN